MHGGAARLLAGFAQQDPLFDRAGQRLLARRRVAAGRPVDAGLSGPGSLGFSGGSFLPGAGNSFDNDVFYLRGIAAYGNYTGSGSRGISGIGSLSGQLTSDLSSDVMSFYGETGYRFAIGKFGNVTPFAGIGPAGATLDRFTDNDKNGTGAALQFEDNDASSTVSMLGIRLDSMVDVKLQRSVSGVVVGLGA